MFLISSSSHLLSSQYILSPSLPVVTQIRGHIAGPPPSSPLRYNNAFNVIARKKQHFLPSSTRVELHYKRTPASHAEQKSAGPCQEMKNTPVGNLSLSCQTLARVSALCPYVFDPSVCETSCVFAANTRQDASTLANLLTTYQI